MRETIYLDNAATSHPKPEAVYRAVNDCLRNGGSAGRGSYSQSLSGGRLLFEIREALAGLFNVDNSERFLFTGNATQAINQALFGVLMPGDRVVTTTIEHNAVVRPLRELQDRGIEVVKIPVDPGSGRVDPEKLKQSCLSAPTRLLLVNHCSNVIGTLQPVEQLGPWCHEQGILFMLDGSQTAGAIPIDLTALEVDLFAAPGHKCLLGPQGTGFLYCAEGVEMVPLIYGGTGGSSASDRQPSQLPERFESGTFNLPGLAGLYAALNFLKEYGIDRVRARELANSDFLYQGLSAIPGIILYGPAASVERSAVISFNLEGRDPSEVGFLLNQHNVAVRTGLHCAPDAHRSIGTFPQGTVRVSPGLFTTAEELDHFLAFVRKISS